MQHASYYTDIINDVFRKGKKKLEIYDINLVFYDFVIIKLQFGVD